MHQKIGIFVLLQLRKRLRRLLEFFGIRTIDTGLKHGTVTAILDNGEQYEITTFRVDGAYSDGRHPDSVYFVDDIQLDLSRRDFTMNAIAWNQFGLVDPFCGREDLSHGVISCVGNPDDRFSEDALRILRALRFASMYNFTIDEKTSESIHRNKYGLESIAAERIRSELCKMLCGEGILKVLLDYSDVIAVIIPELEPCIGFDQNNRYHQYTVYDHIAHAVSNHKGNDISVKVALLLHDIGKPLCYSEDENGGHFHGHALPGRDIAESIMNRLRFDNKTKTDVLELVLYHDSAIEPTQKTVRRWLNKIGEHRFSQLLDIRMADILAHTEGTQESRIERCLALGRIMEEIKDQEQCFTMKDLAIRGRDILSLGIPEGEAVGKILHHILNMVINGELKNDLNDQITEAEKFYEERISTLL